MSAEKPVYNYSDPVFQMRKYVRWAEEHLLMWELAQKSDVISWEVKEAETRLNIPKIYTVEYRIRSIIGIDENQEPIYGDHHILELGMPSDYPKSPGTLYMQTNAWHPNIKSDGYFKGKICSNSTNFGINYTLPELVIRVGEILQYKNYLAEFIPPYPDDEKVAQWVREVAEPRGIVNLKRNIFVDNTPLLRIDPDLAVQLAKLENTPQNDESTPYETEAVLEQSEPNPIRGLLPDENPSEVPQMDEVPPVSPDSTPRIRIVVKDSGNTPPPPKDKIIIKPKN